MPEPHPPLSSRHVAVVGAGAAGLVAARELRREGHDVVVFERGNQVGGIWVYDPRIESDPLGLDPNRRIIHSSLYSSLRTNLPRELMAFREYPFLPKMESTRDPRRFPGHREVLLYLQDFAREFEIEDMVRFETEVIDVRFVEDIKKWNVRTKKGKSENDSEVGFDFGDETFDAVVVCSGIHTEPRVARIPGISSWPGKQLHSHNYRTPEPFQDQVVIVIGGASSGADICREVAQVAKEVHVASRSLADGTYKKQPGYDNLWFHSMIQSANGDGSVGFRNGKVVHADVILHCTGYKYHFPFLHTDGIVTVDDNCVGPVYKHVFPPALAPWLSFVGLPWQAALFAVRELQSKWIAGVLSGRIVLPSPEKMMNDVTAFYQTLEASNIPKRYAHKLGDSQLDYCNWLAARCGCPAFEEWRLQMYNATTENRIIRRPETYHDEFDDDDLILKAYEDLTK